MKGYAYLPGVATLALEADACIGCGMCTEVCPHQVFALSGDTAAIVDRDRCMECGACQANCPAAAIRVEAGVGCAAGMIREWLNGVLPGRARRARCC